jgi:hypothetical protein
MKLPKLRSENIVVQNVNDEVLIYDLQADKAVCLNSTSAIVFNQCDGETTFEALKKDFKFSDDLIHLALEKLNETNLLAGYESNVEFSGLSRREVIKRVGLGTMIALPMVSALVAPSAAHAASGPGLNANTFAPQSRNENETCFDNTDCTLFNGNPRGCCTTANLPVSPTNQRVCRAGNSGFNCT